MSAEERIALILNSLCNGRLDVVVSALAFEVRRNTGRGYQQRSYQKLDNILTAINAEDILMSRTPHTFLTLCLEALRLIRRGRELDSLTQTIVGSWRNRSTAKAYYRDVKAFGKTVELTIKRMQSQPASPARKPQDAYDLPHPPDSSDDHDRPNIETVALAPSPRAGNRMDSLPKATSSKHVSSDIQGDHHHRRRSCESLTGHRSSVRRATGRHEKQLSTPTASLGSIHSERHYDDAYAESVKSNTRTYRSETYHYPSNSEREVSYRIVSKMPSKRRVSMATSTGSARPDEDELEIEENTNAEIEVTTIRVRVKRPGSQTNR